METKQITAATVFQHHLEAFGNNDLNKLLKDYTAHSEIWTPEREIIGLEAISAFYPNAFALFPTGSTTLELKKMTAKGDKVYVIWIADSPLVTVSFATDCFEMRQGKIVWQSTAFQMEHK